MSRRRIHRLRKTQEENVKETVSPSGLRKTQEENVKETVSPSGLRKTQQDHVKGLHLLFCERLNWKMSRGLHLLGYERLNGKLWNLMVHTRLCMILPEISSANDSYFNVVFLYLISVAGRHRSDCCSACGKKLC
jgi:hypothetical protein